jgi:hypothetical protein
MNFLRSLLFVSKAGAYPRGAPHETSPPQILDKGESECL